MAKKKISEKKKKQIFKESGGQCFWCRRNISRKNMTVDHFLPKALGGTNAIENLVASCHACNQVKGAQMPADFVKRSRLRLQ